MIRIYREGVKTALGPEVERWDGIIRDIAADPIGTKEMSDVEKRVSTLFCLSSWLSTHSSSWYHIPCEPLVVLRATQFRDAEATINQRLPDSSVDRWTRSTKTGS